MSWSVYGLIRRRFRFSFLTAVGVGSSLVRDHRSVDHLCRVRRSLFARVIVP